MIPGEKSRGILPALQFLKKVNSGRTISLGKRVAVIGGGNSALDAARCARRLGSEPVILYRRSVEEMPALRSEGQALQNEGIQILPFIMPKQIITERGRVPKIECLKTQCGEVGRDGRRTPIPIEGSNFFLEFDTVIVAAGESSDFLASHLSCEDCLRRLNGAQRRSLQEGMCATEQGRFQGH
jgi:NADPH-dependent glutamate synthase beta subunit-like oxidoreductase